MNKYEIGNLAKFVVDKRPLHLEFHGLKWFFVGYRSLHTQFGCPLGFVMNYSGLDVIGAALCFLGAFKQRI